MLCGKEYSDASASTSDPLISTDKPVSGTVCDRKRRFNGGRSRSKVWSFFTDADSPHKSISAICKHCNKLCYYYKKSEIARAHLFKCSSFKTYIEALDACDIPKWWTMIDLKKMIPSNGNEVNEGRKSEMYRQIKDYTVAAKTEKRKYSFRYKMLVEGKKTPLEYWLTDGAFWPLLQRIALEIFSPRSPKKSKLRKPSSDNITESKLHKRWSVGAIKKEESDSAEMSAEQDTSGTSRPKRRASLQSVSMIKHLVASAARRKRKAPLDGDTFGTPKKESKQSMSPSDVSISLDDLDETLFPRDNGLEYRLGARLRAQDEFGKWYTAKIMDINPKNGHMLIHFDYWSQRYDEWIPANSDRLTLLENIESKANFEPLQVGDFVFARWNETGTYPAQIVEFLESDRYKLLYYDGFEKVAHRRNLKKMTDEEVKQLDLINFGRLKILPAYPDVMFDPNVAGKLHDLGSRRRSSKNASLNSSAVDSSKYDTPFSRTDDDRTTLKTEPKEDTDNGQVVDKASMKPLPKRKSLNLRSIDKSSTESTKKALSKSKSIVKAAKKFCSKRQTLSSSDSSLVLRSDSDFSSPSENSDDSQTLSNIRDQQMDELPLQNFVSKKDSLSANKEGGSSIKNSANRLLVSFTQDDDDKMCEFLYELLESGQISGTETPWNKNIWSKCHERGLLLNHSAHSLGIHLKRLFSRFNEIQTYLRAPVTKKLVQTYQRWIGSADGSGERPLAHYDRRKSSPSSADKTIIKAEKPTTPLQESSRSTIDADDSSIGANNTSCRNGSPIKKQPEYTPDEIKYAKMWIIGRESWLKHDPISNEYFCSTCRAFYPKGNDGRRGHFLDGVRLSSFCLRRVRNHENSSMHGRAVAWWNIEHEDDAVPLLACNAYYLERSEVPVVKQALKIGEKSKDNNFTRILFLRKKHNRQIYAESQPKQVETDENKTESTISPKIPHVALEQPRKILDNDSIYWLRQDKDAIFCSACKKYGKSEKKLRKEFGIGSHNCPVSFCCMKFEKKEDLEGHINLVHKKNVGKDKQKAISCVCDINKEDSAMIQCFQCSTLQHKKCFDLQQNYDLAAFYICYCCAEDNESATPQRIRAESDILFSITGQLPNIQKLHQAIQPVDQLQRLNTCYQDVLGILERLNHMDRQMKSTNSWNDQATENEKQIVALQDDIDKRLDEIDKIVTDLQPNCPLRASVDEVRSLQRTLKMELNS